MPNLTFEQYLQNQFLSGSGLLPSGYSDSGGMSAVNWGGSYDAFGINKSTYEQFRYNQQQQGKTPVAYEDWAKQVAQAQYGNWLERTYGSRTPWSGQGNGLYDLERQQYLQGLQKADAQAQAQNQAYMDLYKNNVEGARKLLNEGKLTQSQFETQVKQWYESFITPTNEDATKALLQWGLNPPAGSESGGTAPEWKGILADQFLTQITDPYAETLWQAVGATSGEVFNQYMRETNGGQDKTYQQWQDEKDGESGGTTTDTNTDTKGLTDDELLERNRNKGVNSLIKDALANGFTNLGALITRYIIDGYGGNNQTLDGTDTGDGDSDGGDIIDGDVTDGDNDITDGDNDDDIDVDNDDIDIDVDSDIFGEFDIIEDIPYVDDVINVAVDEEPIVDVTDDDPPPPPPPPDDEVEDITLDDTEDPPEEKKDDTGFKWPDIDLSGLGDALSSAGGSTTVSGGGRPQEVKTHFTPGPSNIGKANFLSPFDVKKIFSNPFTEAKNG